MATLPDITLPSEADVSPNEVADGVGHPNGEAIGCGNSAGPIGAEEVALNDIVPTSVEHDGILREPIDDHASDRGIPAARDDDAIDTKCTCQRAIDFQDRPSQIGLMRGPIDHHRIGDFRQRRSGANGGHGAGHRKVDFVKAGTGVGIEDGLS